MEDEIFNIVTDLIREDITKDEARKLLLGLLGVSERFTLQELRDAYDGGMANIDNDGCHIDSADVDFGYVVQDIYCNRM